MYYKLFIFGSKELFALVEIFGPILDGGDYIVYKGVRYKILHSVVVAKEIKFDEAGKRIQGNINHDDKSIINQDLCELYVTEVPSF